MSILIFLIPLSFCLSLLALMAFVWASKDGQFRDLISPARTILLDDEPPPQKRTKHAEILGGD